MAPKLSRQETDRCVAISSTTGERCLNKSEPKEEYCKSHLYKALPEARKLNRIFRSWKFWVPTALTVFFGFLGLYDAIKSPSHEDIRDIVSSELQDLRISEPYTGDEIKNSLGIDCEIAMRQICGSIESASLAFDSGKYKDAQEIYLSLALIFEDNIEIQVNIGLTYYFLENAEEATKHFARALELDPENASIFSNLGIALTLAGNNNLAIQAFNSALTLDPSNPTILFNLSEPLIVTGLVDSARIVLRKALRVDSTDAGVLMSLGTVLLMLDSLEISEKIYRQSIFFEPDNADTWMNLGILYYRQGNYEHAINTYDIALEIAPSVALYINLFVAYSKLGNTSEAKRMWQRAVFLDSLLAKEWAKRSE